MSATASRRPPWQHPRRLRQAAAGAGVLLLGYLVLVFVALLGGPRIGASFLPLPGGGPKPAVPIAGPQPGQPSQNLPVGARGTATAAATTPVPTPGATALPTTLPTATKPGEIRWPAGPPSTPYPTGTPYPTEAPTTQIAETTRPTIPVVTERPPATPTVTPTGRPTTTATPTAPPTSTTPSTPPTTPDDPGKPHGLGGLLGSLLDKLGL
ncbi:hypothetical protein [Kribbella sp. NPDC004875]|uniref:hypothetical protein n=1 Tax=Kribbella sp. NPDC004875 TaxID=3364107 RepID=UPI0036BD6BC8